MNTSTHGYYDFQGNFVSSESLSAMFKHNAQQARSRARIINAHEESKPKAQPRTTSDWMFYIKASCIVAGLVALVYVATKE